MASTSGGRRTARRRTAAVGGVVGLLSVGAAATAPAGAGAAPLGAAAPVGRVVHARWSPAPVVRPLRGVSARINGGTPSATDGTVVFADQVATSSSSYVLTVTQGSTVVVQPLPLFPTVNTEPTILPAGPYTATVTVGSTQVATATFTVTARANVSEDLLPTGAGADPSVELEEYTDPVAAIPTGAAGIGLRPASGVSGKVDAYVDGRLVLSDAAEGASANVVVAPGNHQITVYRAGTHTNPLYNQPLPVGPDSFVPAYLFDYPKAGLQLDVSVYTQGYQFVASDGGVFDFGGYPFEGSTGNVRLNAPIVAATPSPYVPFVYGSNGYYLVGSDGGVFDFGNAAPFEGSAGATKLNKPIVAAASTVNSNGTIGYVLVASDGGVFTFNTTFYGSLGGSPLTSPVVAVAASPGDQGYTLVQADGSLTSFGPGITPQPSPPLQLNKPIVGIALTPDGGGAWLAASDGGVFDFGDAAFYGSTGNIRLNQPVVGITSSYDGLGYALIARDGGVFNFGDEKFFGSTGGIHLNQPVVGSIG